MTVDAVQKGGLAEAAFFHEAASRGFMVFTPLCHAARADCIIRKPGWDPLMIQVKLATWDPARKRYGIGTGRHHKQGGKSSNEAYNERDFDVLVAYLQDMNQWVLIPFDQLKGRQKINIYPGRSGEFKIGDWGPLGPLDQ